MLEPIIRFAIAHRVLVVLLTAMTAVAGVWAVVRLPIDAVPDITNVQVTITTEIPALIPEDIERQVTWPIETAMAGMPGLDYTRSLSRNGFSQVTIVFADSTDLYFARQQVAERLAQARDLLPAGSEPRLGPIATGLGEVLTYVVAFAHPGGAGAAVVPDGQPGWQRDGTYRTPEGERLTTAAQQATYLRTVQDWIVVPQLRTVSGLADVDTIGGAKKQYVVQPDPIRLSALGIGLKDVATALERNNRAAGGRMIERFGESHVVRADGRVRGTVDIGAIVVTVRAGVPIHVRDVADVVIDREVRTGSASLEGQDVVMGTALMLYGSNSRVVASATNDRLREIAPSLPPDVVTTVVLNRQSLVDAVIHTVKTNLVEGAILVAVVLLLLLGSIRGALITAAAIPLSMLLAAIGMERLGISGNLMSLGAIDFGIIVDTAVIIVENCLRRLGERQRDLGRELTLDERLTEVFAATKQMLSPAVFGQAIIITVYIPILLLSGIEGKMFRPMAATVILALVGSFILSVTVLPALVALLVRGNVRHYEPVAVRWARHFYAPLLEGAIRLRWIVVSGATVLFLGSLIVFTRLGSEFLPTLDEGNISYEAMRIPSIGVEQSTLIQQRLDSALSRLPEVRTAFSKTGTAELAFDPMPWNTSDAVIVLKPRSEWPDPTLTKEAVRAKIEEVARQQIGTQFEFSQPIQQRFNELLVGVKSDVAIKVFGDDFEVLLPLAERIAATLRTVPGAGDVRIEQVEGGSSLSVDVHREAAARLGLNVDDVQEAITTGVGGSETGMVFEGDRRYPLVVRLAETGRNDPAMLGQLPIPLPVSDAQEATGGRTISLTPVIAGEAIADRATVPLASVATLSFQEGTNQISRENGKRRVVVQCNAHGRDLGGFVSEAQARVAKDIPLPTGAWLAWGGQYQHYEEARNRLLIVVPVCFAIIFILLFTTFGSFRYAVMVFTAVPLALTGGIIALWIRGMPFSISAAIGFIALSGVAVLNGMVLVSCINEMRTSGRSLVQAVTDGSLLRLRPVLMTALVASLGFLPMAFSTGQGAEVQKPLATVVIGGVLSSTILTLIVLPALYRLWHRSDTSAPRSPANPSSSVI